MKTNNEKIYKSDGLSVEQLKIGVERLNSRYGSCGVAEVRCKAFCYVLNNAVLTIDQSAFFADELAHGDVLRTLRDGYIKKADQVLVGEGDSYFEDRESSAFFSGMDFGHIVPDWERLLTLGPKGILDYATMQAQNADGIDIEFYRQITEVYSAVLALIGRFYDLAKQIDTPQAQKLSASLERLLVGPPQTLYDVLEWTLLYYNLENNLECHYVRSLGKLDILWKPYYENDLKNSVAQDESDNLICEFFKYIHSKNLFANIPFALCGLDKNGQKVYSDFTFRLVKIYASANVYSPKVHVKYSDDLPQDFLLFICNQIISGNSSFLFINDALARSSMRQFGFTEQELYDYEIIGCYEPYACRIETCSTCNGIVSLPKNLELALNDGYDPVTKRQIGPHTGFARDFTSFDQLLTAYKKQLANSIERALYYVRWYETHYNSITSAPLLSATYKYSVDVGKDVYFGGIQHANSGLNAIGIATAVDSLMCLKHFVFENHLLSLDDFNKILLNNWQNNDTLRLQCKNYAQKYGNGIDCVDRLAVEIFDFVAEKINNQPNGRGGVFKMGFFSVDNYMNFAPNLGASADGRLRGEFMSKNITASAGQSVNGLTAEIDSVLRFDYSKCANGCVFDFVVHPSVVKGAKGPSVLLAIIRAYLNNGGFAIHGNVFDWQLLEKAKQDPQSYKNVQVRVCGWNAYFVDLSPEEQDVFVKLAKTAEN